MNIEPHTQDQNAEPQEGKHKKKLSDDFIDGIALLGIIITITAGLSYYLYQI